MLSRIFRTIQDTLFNAPLRQIVIVLLFALFFGPGKSSAQSPSPVHPAAAVRQAAPGNIFLPIVSMRPTPGTSDELIDAAVAQGTISAETGLVYKVFAAFGDNRLPAIYRGDDTEVREWDSVEDVQQQYSSLSADGQAFLAPFLLRPSEPGSWVELPSINSSPSASQPAAPAAIQWGTVSNPGGKVKVWYQTRYLGDDAKARLIADTVDTYIWGELTGIMGRSPLSDEKQTPNGGDERLDIYLVHLADGFYGYTYNHTGCDQSATYVEINSAIGKYLLPSVAHELMHAILLAFNYGGKCGEYRWWREATATWAEDYTYRGDQSEQEYAHYFLNYPEEPLDSTRKKNHSSGAYLFPFFLNRSLGQPGLIRTTYENAATASSSLAAINAALPGGFAVQWPLFARANWNRDSVDYYQQWDDLKKGAASQEDIAPKLNGAPDGVIALPVYIAPLTANYFHLVFSDPGIHTLEIIHAFDPDFDTTASIQALVKYKGRPGWEPPEDWTDTRVHTFCFDVADERVAEVVLIVANSEYQDPINFLQTEDIEVRMTNIGCWRWKGRVKSTYRQGAADQLITEVLSSPEITFERDDVNPGNPYISGFLVIDGTVDWSYRGQLGECTGNAGDSFPAISGDGLLDLTPYHQGSPNRIYSGIGEKTMDVQVTYTCPPDATFSLPFIQFPWFSVPIEKKVDPSGMTIAGSYAFTDTVTMISNSWEWNFTAQVQP